MDFDLNKSYIIRKAQDDKTVSFRICFGSGRDWVGVDFTVDKSEFKELSHMEQMPDKAPAIDTSVFNLERAKTGWKSSLPESPVEGEMK